MKHSVFVSLVAVGLSLAGRMPAFSEAPPRTNTEVCNPLSGGESEEEQSSVLWEDFYAHLKYSLHPGDRTATVVSYYGKQYGYQVPERVTYQGIDYTVTSIGDSCFAGLDRMSDVKLPETVTSLGKSCFAGCIELTDVNFPQGLTSIGDSCFASCSMLYSVDLPEGLVSLGDYCFSRCYNLTDVLLPEGLVSLGKSCFSGCDKLTSVTLPKGLVSVYGDMFDRCSGLRDIYCEALVPPAVNGTGDTDIDFFCDVALHVSAACVEAYRADDWWGRFYDYVRVTDKGLSFILKKSDTTAIVVPGAEKYAGNIVVQSHVTFGGADYAVTSLGNYSFYECSGLKTVTLPEGLVSIGDGCFSGCSGLTVITLPQGVESLGASSLAWCSRLASITLPEGLVTMAANVFDGDTGLTDIYCQARKVPTITGTDKKFDASIYNVNLHVPEGMEQAYRSDDWWRGFFRFVIVTDKGLDYSIDLQDKTAKLLTTGFRGEVVIPHHVSYGGEECVVVSFKENAFSQNSYLTGIELPDGIKTLPVGCFYKCRSLKSVVLPEGLKELPINCFFCCGSLSDIVLPEGLTSLGDRCFYECSSLKNVVLPVDLTSLGDRCFYECGSLKNVVLPEGLTSLGKSCFGGCESLSDIVLPDGLTSLGEDCFGGCSSLKTLVFPDGLTALGEGSFGHCKGLVSVTLPKNLSSNLISYAFDTCDDLKDVYCYTESVPRITWYFIPGPSGYYHDPVIHPQTTLHVLDHLMDDYKKDSFWSIFGNIVGDTDGIGTAVADGVSVRLDGHRLSVEGLAADDVLMVTDMAGRMVYKGVQHETRLDVPGLYLVSVKGRTVKVCVR